MSVTSSCWTLVSAAEGIVGRNLTVNRAGDPGRSESSVTAAWRCNFGLTLGNDDANGAGTAVAAGVAAAAATAGAALEALDLDIRQVLVDADPLESFLDELKFESWLVFLVTSQEDARRLGSASNLKGMPQ